MKLENQLTSLEPAKKLKKLGMKQESAWYWQRQYFEKKDGAYFPTDEEIFILKRISNKAGEFYSAFTIAELGEVLPNDFMSYKKDDDMWLCCKHHPEIGKDNEMIMEFADIEADARAKMLIYLIENKFVKVEEL